jgi:hypothetical protein
MTNDFLVKPISNQVINEMFVLVLYTSLDKLQENG